MACGGGGSSSATGGSTAGAMPPPPPSPPLPPPPPSSEITLTGVAAKGIVSNGTVVVIDLANPLPLLTRLRMILSRRVA